MALVGLLLLAAALVVTVDVVHVNAATITVDAFGRSFSTSPGWLFVVGMGVALVGVVGLLLVNDGLARLRRRRAVLASSRDATEDLAAERDRLAAQLQSEREARARAESGTLSGRAKRVDLSAEEARAEHERAEDRDARARSELA